MKQITLNNDLSGFPHRARLCLKGLLLRWGAFGLAVAVLWRLAGDDGWAQAGVWAIAVIAGFGLMAQTTEV
jgi:hypothetical protein